jgi:CRP/FNR family transcriptional regulator
MSLTRQKQDVIGALRTLPMFRGLPDPDLERLAAVARLRDYERGERLWNEGDPADALTVIVRGRVKVVRQAEHHEAILELFGEGEPVGAVAFYGRTAYPAAAEAITPVWILVVPRREYFDLLERYPALARGLIGELTKIMVSLSRRLEDNRAGRVAARVARLFVTLAERVGTAGPGGIEVPIRLTRQEIGDLAGTTLESVSRVMSAWERDAVLTRQERGFLIPSLEALRRRGTVEIDPGAD